MKFSICIPTYNREKLIGRAIQSVLNQTYANFEILVIDDGSTDNTKGIMEQYRDERIRYYVKCNGGKHSALNLGIKEAKGDLFMILDSDDYLLPNALELFHSLWIQNKVEENNTLCGIMCRCSSNDRLIGERFPEGLNELSYIEFHYKIKNGHFQDCCECLKTSVLKCYSWPEDENTRFVPESYVMDQIGMKYKLICRNDIVQVKDYQNEGITNNVKEHRRKNYVGYLYDIVSKIDDILPNTRIIPLKYQVLLWWRYWNLKRIDINNVGVSVNRVTPMGKFVRFILPVLNRIKGSYC